MELMSAVWQVIAGEEYTVYAYCSDGLVRLVDVKPLLEKGTVFEPLMDKFFFRDRLTVMNDTVAWDVSGDRDPYKCVDLDPDNIFLSAPVVDCPLSH